MPSEIGWSFNGARQGEYETAFPGETVRLQIYDEDEDLYHLLLILCDTEDVATRVFQFEQSAETNLETPGEELSSYCTEDNLLALMPHEDEHTIDTHSQPGIGMRIFIGHQTLICCRDKVFIYPDPI